MENGQTVSTEFGDVVLDDTTPDTGSETQQPGEDAGTGTDGVAQAVEQMIKLGNSEYTPAQLQQFIEEAKNAKAMRREADRRYKEAKQLQDDPELAELKRIQQLIANNEALRNEYALMKKWAAGKVQAPGTSGLAQLAAKQQALEARFEELDRMKDHEGAKVTLNGFLEMHNKIPGVQPWTEDNCPEYDEFFAEFAENTDPNDTDIEAYFWKTQGPKLLSSVATSARGAAKAEVEQTITAGRRASANTTAPSGQRSGSYDPDVSNPSFNAEIEAAIKDSSLFDKL